MNLYFSKKNNYTYKLVVVVSKYFIFHCLCSANMVLSNISPEAGSKKTQLSEDFRWKVSTDNIYERVAGCVTWLRLCV